MDSKSESAISIIQHTVQVKDIGPKICMHLHLWHVNTLVPEVFLDISLHERAVREPLGEHKSRSGEKEKPLVTLDLNLTFMQTPAVKRINLIIQKGTNGSLAIMCLSTANVSTWVVRSGIFWPTWPGSMCMFARMFSSATIAKVNCLLNILRCKHLHF